MKSKAAIPLVLLVCITPLALQQRAISRLHHENERLRGLASAAGETFPRPNRPHAATAALPAGLSSNLDIYVLLEESDRSSLSGIGDQFQAKLNALPPETLVRLVKESANLRAHSDRKHALFAQLLTALEQTSPELALNTAIDAVDDPETLFRLIEAARIGERLASWAAVDLDAALAWFLAHSQTSKLQSLSNKFRSLSSVAHLTPYLLSALISAGHPEASAILSDRSEQDRYSLITDSIRRSRSFPKSEDLRTANLETFARYLFLLREQNFPSALQEQAWGELSTGLFLSTFSEFTAFLQLAEATPEETQAIAVSYLRPKLSSVMPFDPDQEKRIKAEVAAFLEDLLPDQADAIFAEIADQIDKNRANRARQILDQLKSQPSITDRHLAEQLIRNDLRTHTEEALEQAARIQDPGLRQSTIETLRSR